MIRPLLNLFLFSALHLHLISDNSNHKVESGHSQKNEFIGTWIYSFPYYYSELKIHKNGKFSYYDGGCMAKHYSQGNWEIADGKLCLTSLPKYKFETKTIVWSDSSKRTTKNIDSQTLKDTTVGLLGIHIQRPDTSNIYFDRKLFLEEKGTLIELDKYQAKTEAKYIKKYRSEVLNR